METHVNLEREVRFRDRLFSESTEQKTGSWSAILESKTGTWGIWQLHGEHLSFGEAGLEGNIDKL